VLPLIQSTDAAEPEREVYGRHLAARSFVVGRSAGWDAARFSQYEALPGPGNLVLTSEGGRLICGGKCGLTRFRPPPGSQARQAGAAPLRGALPSRQYLRLPGHDSILPARPATGQRCAVCAAALCHVSIDACEPGPCNGQSWARPKAKVSSTQKHCRGSSRGSASATSAPTTGRRHD
jgi:hypothetical protein